VPLKEVLNTGLFDFEKTSQSAGWIEELNKDHVPETEEYGISSFVFRDKRPFHPVRFWNYLNREWHSNIIRSKGLFWLASRKNEALNWSQAGGSLRADKAGVWWCSMPYSDRIGYAAFVDNQGLIEKKWDKRFGDRENELVIIGQDLDKETIIRELTECLCTDGEIRDMEVGLSFKDPFPLN
jgi:G3E family GTPase